MFRFFWYEMLLKNFTSMEKKVTFKTTLGTDCTFSIPSESISENQTVEVDDPSKAVFCDSNRNIYDKFYQQILLTKNSENPSNIYKLLNNDFDANDLKFPNPRNYNSKPDFLLACSSWKQRVMKQFNGLTLPKPITSYHYYPVKSKIIVKGTQQFRSFKPDIDPPIPLNFLKLFEMFRDENTFDEEEPFPNQTPNRAVVKYGHQASSKQQWQSQLVPQEPIPEFYDTFEEFEKAYKNWASVLAQNMNDNPIPPSSIFENTAKIDIVKEDKLEDSFSQNQFDVPLETNLLKSQDLNYDFTFGWAKDIQNKELNLNTESIHALYQNCIDMKGKEINAPTVPQKYSIFGIDSTKSNIFLVEFKEFGVHGKTLNSISPLHPTHVFQSSNTAKRDIDSLFRTVIIGKRQYEQFERFLRIPFDQETLNFLFRSKTNIRVITSSKEEIQNSLQTLIESSDNNEFDSLDPSQNYPVSNPLLNPNALSTILAPSYNRESIKKRHRTIKAGEDSHAQSISDYLQYFLSPKNFSFLLSILENSNESVYRRLGLTLPFLMNSSYISELLNVFSDLNNIQDFYRFVTIALFNEIQSDSQIFPPEMGNSIFQMISQLYYFDKLINVKVEQFKMRAILTKCRELSIIISHELLQNQNIRNEIWTNIENSNILSMINSLNSSQVFASILLDDPNDIFSRINEMSKTNSGRKILLRFAYCYNNNAFYEFIYLNGLQISYSTTNFTAEVYVLYLTNFINIFSNKSINASVFYPLFDHTKFLHVLILAAKIVCGTGIFVSNSQFSFPDTVSKISLCNGDFDLILLCLREFCQFEQCCTRLAISNEFCDLLRQGLCDKTHPKRLRRSWHLMSLFLRFPVSIYVLLNNESIKRAIKDCPNSDSSAVILEYFTFLRFLWVGPCIESEDVALATTLALSSCMGRIACLVLTMDTSFPDQLKTREAISEYKNAVFNATNPNLVQFAKSFSNHLTPDK